MSHPTLVVAGGGVAGLTAALEAASSSQRVILCEATQRLGGRAFSFPVPALGGAEVENGPHALVGAYERFRHLLRALGTEALFSRPATLRMGVAASTGIHDFRAWPALPGPLALLGGLLGFRPLSTAQKLRTARALAPLLYGPPPVEERFGSWLTRKHLTGPPADTLLVPLCRAVLNTHQSEASLALLAAAFRSSFKGKASNAALWLPRASWGRILDAPARALLAAKGIELRLKTRVVGIDLTEKKLNGVRLSGDEHVACAAVVWAVPPWQARGALPPGLVPELDAAPMGTLHLRLACDPPWREPVVALGRESPFDFVVLGSGRLCALQVTGRANPPGGRDGLAERAAFLLGLPVEKALWVPQPAATLRQPAGCDRFRPAGITVVPGLFLAGDWTATGLPATLEGAALAGSRAGRAAANFLAGKRIDAEENQVRPRRW